MSSPTLTANAVTWLHATTATYGSCRRIRELRRRDLTTGAKSYAKVGAVSAKEAVVGGGRMVTLSPWPHDNGPRDRDACVPENMADSPDVRGCAVRLLPPPRWRPGESGRMRRGGRHGRRRAAQPLAPRPGRRRAAPGASPRRPASDLDLGPGPDGAVWAVYMRLRRARLSAAGATTWPTGVEQELGVGLGIRPAIWRGRVALWLLAGPRPAHRRLVVAHVGGVRPDPRGQRPGATPTRAAAGRRPPTCPAGASPTSDAEGGESRSSPLRVGVAPAHGQGVQPADLGGYGEECDYVVASPTLTRFGLTWLGASSGDAGACGAPSTALHRVFWRRGRDVTQRARLPVVSAVEGVLPGGGGAVTLAPPPGTARTAVVVEPCYLDDARHFHARYGCRVAAGRPPALQA